MGRRGPGSCSTWENATHASPMGEGLDASTVCWLLAGWSQGSLWLLCQDRWHQSEGKRHCGEGRGVLEKWCVSKPQPTAGLCCRLGPSGHRGPLTSRVSTQASGGLASFPAARTSPSASLLSTHPGLLSSHPSRVVQTAGWGSGAPLLVFCSSSCISVCVKNPLHHSVHSPCGCVQLSPTRGSTPGVRVLALSWGLAM